MSWADNNENPFASTSKPHSTYTPPSPQATGDDSLIDITDAPSWIAPPEANQEEQNLFDDQLKVTAQQHQQAQLNQERASAVPPPPPANDNASGSNNDNLNFSIDMQQQPHLNPVMTPTTGDQSGDNLPRQIVYLRLANIALSTIMFLR